MPYHGKEDFLALAFEIVTENIEPRPVTETSFSAAPAAAEQTGKPVDHKAKSRKQQQAQDNSFEGYFVNPRTGRYLQPFQQPRLGRAMPKLIKTFNERLWCESMRARAKSCIPLCRVEPGPLLMFREPYGCRTRPQAVRRASQTTRRPARHRTLPARSCSGCPSDASRQPLAATRHMPRKGIREFQSPVLKTPVSTCCRR